MGFEHVKFQVRRADSSDSADATYTLHHMWTFRSQGCTSFFGVSAGRLESRTDEIWINMGEEKWWTASFLGYDEIQRAVERRGHIMYHPYRHQLCDFDPCVGCCSSRHRPRLASCGLAGRASRDFGGFVMFLSGETWSIDPPAIKRSNGTWEHPKFGSMIFPGKSSSKRRFPMAILIAEGYVCAMILGSCNKELLLPKKRAIHSMTPFQRFLSWTWGDFNIVSYYYYNCLAILLMIYHYCHYYRHHAYHSYCCQYPTIVTAGRLGRVVMEFQILFLCL